MMLQSNKFIDSHKFFDIMNLNDLLEPIVELFSWTFGILEALGNSFNWIIIAIISIMGIIWIKKMADFNKEAKENGTLK